MEIVEHHKGAGGTKAQRFGQRLEAPLPGTEVVEDEIERTFLAPELAPVDDLAVRELRRPQELLGLREPAAIVVDAHDPGQGRLGGGVPTQDERAEAGAEVDRGSWATRL